MDHGVECTAVTRV